MKANEKHKNARLEAAEKIQNAKVEAARRAGLNEDGTRSVGPFSAFMAKAKEAAKTAAILGKYGLQRTLANTSEALSRVRTPRQKNDVPPGETFLIVGHRGAAGDVVENTIESAKFAVEQAGANAVEIDLCLTKDEEVVVWHDWEPNEVVALARQLGLEPNVKYQPDTPHVLSSWRRSTHELTLAELREHYGYKKTSFLFFKRAIPAHIPSFDEFVAWAAKEPRLKAVFLDIKLPGDQVALAPRMAERIMEILGRHETSFETVFMTPREPVLHAMKPIAGAASFTFDVEVPPGICREPTEHSAIRKAISLGNRFASVGRPALTYGAWDIYQTIITHDLKLRQEHNTSNPAKPVTNLISWTLNKRPEMKRIMEMGVQGILTDKPKALSKLAKKAGRAT